MSREEAIARARAAIAAVRPPQLATPPDDRRERCVIGTCTRGADHTGPHAPAEDGVSAT